MKIYVISYDLNKPGQDYKDLHNAIKNYAWAHFLDSTWFVKTNDSADDIYKTLKPHIGNNDFIFIAELDKYNYNGWMPQTLWDWWNE